MRKEKYYTDKIVVLLEKAMKSDKNVLKFMESNIHEKGLEEVKSNLLKTIKLTEKLFKDNPNNEFPVFFKREYTENILKVALINEKLNSCKSVELLENQN